MKHFFLSILIVGFAWSSELLAADSIVVVVAKKSPIAKLSLAQVKALYLGETRFAAPGQSVELHDRDRSSTIFHEFYKALADMTPKQVSIHWNRKVFAGEAPPPARDVGDDRSVIEVLKQKPEAISYIYEKNLNPQVRIVYSFKDK